MIDSARLFRAQEPLLATPPLPHNHGASSEVLHGEGDGAISAFVNSLGVPLRVVDYHEHAIGAGTETKAACYVEARIGDAPTGFGVGVDRDIVTASFRAVLSGLNRYVAQYGTSQLSGALDKTVA